jgi:hypothetical protein
MRRGLTRKQKMRRSSTRKNYKKRQLTRKKLFVCKRRVGVAACKRKQHGGDGVIHEVDGADTAVVKIIEGVPTVMSQETYERDYAGGKVDHVGDI